MLSKTHNNNLLHLKSAFWALKALYIVRGVSPHPPPMCSIHLDDATAAKLRHNAHHTPAYLAHSSEEGPPFSRAWHQIAPASRFVEPLCVAPGRDTADLSGLPLWTAWTPSRDFTVSASSQFLPVCWVTGKWREELAGVTLAAPFPLTRGCKRLFALQVQFPQTSNPGGVPPAPWVVRLGGEIQAQYWC